MKSFSTPASEAHATISEHEWTQGDDSVYRSFAGQIRNHLPEAPAPTRGTRAVCGASLIKAPRTEPRLIRHIAEVGEVERQLLPELQLEAALVAQVHCPSRVVDDDVSKDICTRVFYKRWGCLGGFGG